MPFQKPSKKDTAAAVLFSETLLPQISIMAETVFLTKVLEAMRTPSSEGRAVPFDISYRTLNRNSKTGGKLKYHENAKLVMKEKQLDPHSIQALRHFKPSAEKKNTARKNPQHFTNKTRNIRLENGEIKKIHINHIITFNGKKVIY